MRPPLLTATWLVARKDLKIEFRTRTAFLAVMHSTLTFLRISTVGDLLLLIGHILFLLNISGLVLGFYRARATATYAELTADLFKPAGAKS